MILVSGATGLLGRAVLDELLARGVTPLRAIYRDKKDANAFGPKVEAVQGDYEDRPSIERALAGVDAVYLVCGAVPELVKLESSFLDAIKSAGTPYLVLQSAFGAGQFDKTFPSWHRQVELKAEALQIPRAVLRPTGFMQNVRSFFADSIKAQDCFYDALGQARLCHIDVRDIAAVAANALTSKPAGNPVYELHGPEALSDAELARRISKVAGRPIKYVELTMDQMRQGMISAGMPAPRATAVVELYEFYLTGKGEGSDQALRQMIGREPRRIDAYLSEISASFTK